MKKYIKLLPVAFFIVLLMSYYHYSNAEDWQKVADTGFDNPRNDYVWSMETFKGKLYVGTLNLWGGAEIWSSNSGEPGTWQRVYKARFSRNYGIRRLYSDGDHVLYACASNKMGAQILRTFDGQNWKTVARRGFRNRKNMTIRCMVRFGEYLYVGVGGDAAKLYRSRDGLNWELVNDKSFDSTKVPDPKKGLVTNNVMIGELAVFNNQIYAFTWTKDANYRSTRWLLNRSIQESIQDNNSQDPSTLIFLCCKSC